ncbi:hypothetical protein [Bryobacter aggregatus]|uniref:hypothetical protein n=1 Tax=Bryobacter aggregatus TaxID=360054 RepID=UPI0004E249E1|nr:hypothetical protein [Bryobacter aggregatus]
MFEQQKSELDFDASRVLPYVGMGLLVLVLAIGIGIATDTRGLSLFYIWILWVALIVVRWQVHGMRRRREVRGFADKIGFSSIGPALPIEHPFYRTSLRSTSPLRNAYAGQVQRREMLFFDLSVGSGKHRFDRSAIALRGKPEEFGTLQFGPDLVTEEADGWTWVYGRRRLLEIEELNELVLEIDGVMRRDEV